MESDSTKTLQLISDYVTALCAGDTERMEQFRTADFVLDFVHGDAFEDGPLSAEETRAFWPAWFSAFPEMDYEVTRTIVAETVVVTEWIFTGTQTEPLGSPIFEAGHPASGRTIRFRGVTVYDVVEASGVQRIQRETTYMDLATLMVELGVKL